MKIKFPETEQEFEILNIHYELDEKGQPIDIIIIGAEEVLYAISNYSRVGFNCCLCEDISKLSEYPDYEPYQALYARLNDFIVKGAKRIYYV